MDEADKNFELAVVLWGGVFVAILTAGFSALYEGHYYFAAALIVVGFAGVIAVTTHVKGKRLKLEHAAIGALILTWIFFGYDICDRHYFSPAVETDARLLPFAKGSTFFDSLPLNNDSVMLWCFPYEAQSCSIARQFRERLAGRVGTILNWNGFITGLSPLPADFKGINIATHSDEDRPLEARALYSKLRELQVPCEFKTDEALGPKDFAVWIGGKP